MPRLVNLPADYARLGKLQRISPHYWAFPQLRRFAYRYRLAKSFQRIEATGFGRSIDTYSAFTKLFLTYTAYEQLVPVANKLRVSGVSKVDTNVIFDKRLAAQLRRNTKLAIFLTNSNLQYWLRKRIENMLNGTDDDIVCLAFGIRNLYAHGELTTTDILDRTVKQRAVLVDVADTLLDYCDKTFSGCMDKL